MFGNCQEQIESRIYLQKHFAKSGFLESVAIKRFIYFLNLNKPYKITNWMVPVFYIQNKVEEVLITGGGLVKFG